MCSTFNETVSHVLSLFEDVNARLSKVPPLWLIVGSISGTVVFLKVRRLIRFGPDIPLHKR